MPTSLKRTKSLSNKESEAPHTTTKHANTHDELAQPIHKGKRIEGEPDKISKMHIIDIYNAIKK